MRWFVLVLFLFSTSFFVYQHSTGLSWDFVVYALNAHHLLSGTGYLEPGRPPLASFIMMLGEYTYIILVSLACLFACLKFSFRYKLSPELFYSLILSPFVLVYGFSVGTELLSLSLIILLFSYIDRPVSGVFAGLGILAHYSNFLNSFFLFFTCNYKKLFLSVLFLVLTLLPWLFFNYFVFGDPFYSFLDQFAKNVAARGFVASSPSVMHFVIVSSFLLPLFLFGLYKSFRKPAKIDVFMVFFLVLRLITYLLVPLKFDRYLFLLVLPLSFFSCKFLKKPCLAYIVFALTLVLLPFYYFPLESPVPYRDAVSRVNSSCMVLSNAWPLINYLGVNAGPAPWQDFVSKRVNEGYTLILFKGSFDPSYVLNTSFMRSLPIINESGAFFIIKNESVCKPSFYYNWSYIQERNFTSNEMYNESFSFTVWDLLK